MSKQKENRKCPRCRGGQEVFWYMGLYEFDVDRACALAQDGREPVEVEEESVRLSVEESHVHEEHVAHVNGTEPGVIAHVRYCRHEGTEFRGHVLIDGHHRAARCLQEGRPYFAYLLTEEESESVLLRHQDSPLPRAKTRPRKQDGAYFLKSPHNGKRYSFDEHELFLYSCLNGKHTARSLRTAFESRFGGGLAQEDLNAFLMMVQSRGFLHYSDGR